LFSGQTGRDREIVLVETTVGRVFCTPDHEIWTARGFVRADALRYGDEVLGASSPCQSLFPRQSASSGMATAIAAIRKVSERLTGYISGAVSQVVRVSCIGMFGSSIAALSQRDGT